MLTLKTLLLGLLGTLSLSSPHITLAESAVWEVSKGPNKIFIGGTFHVLREQDYPLPAEFNYAFQQAQTIIFETDLSAIAQPEFGQQLAANMLYRDGRTLRSELSQSTWQQLQKYTAERDIPLEALNIFKPTFVILSLTMAEYRAKGYKGGVDEHFHRQALNNNKSISHLESPQEQINFLLSMGTTEPNDMIKSSLKELRELEDMADAMVRAWRRGDMEELHKLGAEEMKKTFPNIYRSLLSNRNRNWLPRIEKLLQSPAVEFVLVGSLHLSGDDSLLLHLQKMGYTITQVGTP